jgi:ankyrin repeat protein
MISHRSQRPVPVTLAFGEGGLAVSAVYELIEAIEEGRNDRALELLRSDPGLAHQPEYEPVLHAAIRAKNPDLVTAIVRAGADINAPGDWGQSPLHAAVRSRNVEMVRLVLSFSPDLTATDAAGITPLLLAARSGEPEIADELIRHGAELDFHSAVALGRVGEVRAMLARDPGVIRTARHPDDLLPDAVYSNSLDTVAALLDCPGIDVHAFGLSGDPPLTAAVSYSSADPAIARLLLRKGADPRRPNKHGETAISRAEQVGVLHWLDAVPGS